MMQTVTTVATVMAFVVMVVTAGGGIYTAILFTSLVLLTVRLVRVVFGIVDRFLFHHDGATEQAVTLPGVPGGRRW